MLKIGLLYHEDFKRHQPSPEHPEGPWRSEAVFRFLLSGPLAQRLKPKEPRPATFEELELVHEEAYLLRLEEACLRGDSHLGSQDNELSFDTFEVARLAAGAALEAVELVKKGEPLVFSPLRPPGHHALPAGPLGFCFFNNCALAARYWLEAYGARRLLVLDWDAHHGNGIQDIFYEEDRIFYLSLHEDPRRSFPGTGFPEERGRERGLGFTLNLPLPLGAGDEEVLSLFREKVLPVLRDYAPEGVIIAAGFDSHRDDDLSFLNLTSKGYYGMAKLLGREAKRLGAPVISLLEGGYEPEALVVSVERHLVGLIEGLEEP